MYPPLSEFLDFLSRVHVYLNSRLASEDAVRIQVLHVLLLADIQPHSMLLPTCTLPVVCQYPSEFHAIVVMGQNSSKVHMRVMVTRQCDRLGGCTYWPKTEDTFYRHVGSRTEASKHGLPRHLRVSRHMPGEDSEDTWVSEDTFLAETVLGAKNRGRPKTLPRRTALAKALPGVKKPCAHEKTTAEDKSGQGTIHREDTWACEGTS